MERRTFTLNQRNVNQLQAEQAKNSLREKVGFIINERAINVKASLVNAILNEMVIIESANIGELKPKSSLAEIEKWNLPKLQSCAEDVELEYEGRLSQIDRYSPAFKDYSDYFNNAKIIGAVVKQEMQERGIQVIKYPRVSVSPPVQKTLEIPDSQSRVAFNSFDLLALRERIPSIDNQLNGSAQEGKINGENLPVDTVIKKNSTAGDWLAEKYNAPVWMRRFYNSFVDNQEENKS